MDKVAGQRVSKEGILERRLFFLIIHQKVFEIVRASEKTVIIKVVDFFLSYWTINRVFTCKEYVL